MQSKHNSKLKKHLTRALSLMLAFALVLSTPLTTYAGVGDSGDNTGGGGGGMSGSTSALAWSQNHQGYRMYIIDENFIRISKVYDFYYSEPQGVGTVLRNTRFDGPSSPVTDSLENVYPISELQEWCDSEFEVPKPTKLVNGNRVGNGQEFKEWFFAGREGTRIPGRDNSSGGGNTGGNTGNPTNQSYNNTVITSLTVEWSDFIGAATSIECGDALYDAPPNIHESYNI